MRYYFVLYVKKQDCIVKKTKNLLTDPHMDDMINTLDFSVGRRSFFYALF
jgi:hypothetical protein